MGKIGRSAKIPKLKESKILCSRILKFSKGVGLDTYNLDFIGIDLGIYNDLLILCLGIPSK